MKTFFAVFFAILAAALVIYGVFLVRENHAETQAKNDRWIAEYIDSASRIESRMKSYNEKEWKEHIERIQFIRSYVKTTKPLTEEKAKNALKIAETMEDVGAMMPHPSG